MSRVLSRNIMVLFGIAFLATQISAHGHLATPISREYLQDYSSQDFPVSLPLGADFVCKNKPTLPASMMTTLTAGQPMTMSWSFAAPHPGDCFAYISYDVNVTDQTQQKWFKIAEFRDCNQVNNIPQKITVPSYLPSCDHCILRWEWYALHLQQIGNVEFYAQCADIKIAGSKNGVIPSPLVTIPGHLPMNANMYRDPYGANSATGALIGPPIATPGGALYNCSAQYDSSCTIAPVQRGECTISAQQCVTASTYKACGIGRSGTEWYAPQSCQTGLVCVPVEGDRINCLRPSDVATPVPTPTPAYNPVSYTTAAPKPVTTAAAKPVTTAAAVPMTTAAAKPVTTAAAVPSTTAAVRPATTAAARPSTTASMTPVIPTEQPVPMPPTTPPVVPSGTCTQGNMKCLTSETYSTCDRGSWGASQSCRTGLTCSPSGNFIYCK